MFKKLTIIMIMLTIIGCGNNLTTTKTVNVDIPPRSASVPESITCVHKYDKKRKFTYLQKNSVMYKVEKNLTVYKFTDIHNKDWFINNFEILNYNCVKGQ